MKKWTMRQIVGAGACDPSGRLSLVGALTLVEDAITATMAKLALDGLTVHRKYGALMVFAKNHLKFFEPIKWQDKINVSCFFVTKSAARLNVDVCVKKAGKIVLYARTEVCAVDAQTGRIRRLDSVGVGAQLKTVTPGCDLTWTPMSEVGQLTGTVTVRTSNIDYAGHTNNVEYVRLLLDTFTLEEWRTMVPTEFQVAYLNQSFFGDELKIYHDNQTVDGQHVRCCTIKKADQEILRGLIRW